MHSDLRFHIVMAVMILRDLQDTAVIAHRVIIAYGALLLNAQDVVQPCGKGHEGRPFSSALMAKRALWPGRKRSFRNRFASFMVVMGSFSPPQDIQKMALVH